MVLNTRESAALSRIFALLAENAGERELRVRLGGHLLDLFEADHFASFVWSGRSQRFEQGVWLNMSEQNLATYDAWFQFHDPITRKLQACRHATPVSLVMPHAQLARTEFFNDFLARDGLHWGINLHAFDGERALGDLRIWRGRRRRDFDAHDTALLDLIEPALVAALRRVQPPDAGLSRRERDVLNAVVRGLTDKEIARELALSPTSVRTYLRRLFEKTGTQRRAALARWAERL